MVGQAAVGQDAAVDPRVERLDPAVEHLGEAGHRGHVGHRQAGVAQRPRRAAGRDELEPAGDEAAAQVDQPGLVRDGQQRAARDGDARVRAGEVHGHVPAVDDQRIGQEQRDGPRQQPVLDGPDPVVEARHVVAGQDGDGLLRDDRPAVERRVDEVDRAAGHGHAVRQRVGDRVRARERRQQRRMRVEDPPGERGEDRRPDDPHVAGEDDRVDPDGGQRLGQRRVVAARDERGLDPLLRRPVERRARPVGEDEDDRRRRARRDRRPRRAPAGSTPRPTRRRRSGRSTGALERPLDVAGAADRLDRRSPRRRPSPRSRTRRSPPIAAATAAAGSTTTIPSPPLNVARSSASSRPPSAPNSRMTDGIVQRAGSSRAARPSGRARGTLPGRPPPVMWAMPWRSRAGRPDRGPRRQDRLRVDPGRRQEDLAERRHRLVRGGGDGSRPSPRRRATGAAAPGTARRGRGPTARAAPGPARTRSRAGRTTARPRIASPASHRRPVDDVGPLDDADAAARQVELVGPSGPGCSAVSPPTSAQPASRQPAAIEPTSSATASGTTRPTAT